MAKRNAKKQEEALQKRKEVRGVILIALGVFLAVCLYFEAAGIVGGVITGALYGLFGIFAYALPPALIVGGILMIACAPKPRPYRGSLILTGVLFVITLLHVMAGRLASNVGFIEYVADAYRFGGGEAMGGGALGALLCYPLTLLLGEIGAYIFLIAGILVVILLVSRLSIRETGSKVKTRVQAGLQQASQRHSARKQLYTEPISEAEPSQAAARPQAKKQPGSRAGWRNEAEPLDDVSFLPMEGPIRRSAKSMREPDETPLEIAVEQAAAQTAGNVIAADFGGEEAPVITYYDEGVPEPDDFASASGTTVLDLKQGAKLHLAPEPFEAITVEEGRANEPPVFRAARKENEDIPPFALEDEAFKERPPYVAPSFSLLNPSRASYGRASMEAPNEKGRLLIETLESFNVKARIVNISVGPVITRFELAPAPGVRVNKITSLSDDIALALAAPRVRIEAPIPGKAAVGIEVPNKDTATVVLRDIVESREFTTAASPITLALGKDIVGKVIVADLAKMPHLLIAGATGSGKSVCINDIIISLVYKCTPDELQLILVDPKVVELSNFCVLPHLRVPVVTDPKKAAGAIAGGVREMTERYKKFAQVGARDLARYNEMQHDPKQRLPKLVIIIDELADLMMVAPDTVEDSICRIAQLGRAAGIHLIVATQRPSADVITGLIKANIPSRIAFAVSSAIDSRIILDTGGAEKLLGRGDMLFHPNGAGKPVRAQAAFVADEEVERIVRHFSDQSLSPEFDEGLMEEMEAGKLEGAQGNGKQEDDLLGEAVRIVLDSGQASISMIQRRLRVGYARAARLVDIMEQHGYVSGFDGSKPRKLLITRMQYEQIFGMQASGGQEDG